MHILPDSITNMNVLLCIGMGQIEKMRYLLNGKIFLKTVKRFGILMKNAIRIMCHSTLMDMGIHFASLTPDLRKIVQNDNVLTGAS